VTAADFAALLDARPVGPGKWLGRCPAHRDRNPSYSIAEGRDGRVIGFCFAGCALTAVLKVMGLRLRDLFSTEPPSPEQRRAIEAQRRREQMAGRRIGEAAEYARQLEDHVYRLGGELATLPDDDPQGPEMTERFNQACTAMQLAEQTWQEMRTGRAVNATR
jgi:hypothetical protein